MHIYMLILLAIASSTAFCASNNSNTNKTTEGYIKSKKDFSCDEWIEELKKMSDEKYKKTPTKQLIQDLYIAYEKENRLTDLISKNFFYTICQKLPPINVFCQLAIKQLDAHTFKTLIKNTKNSSSGNVSPIRKKLINRFTHKDGVILSSISPDKNRVATIDATGLLTIHEVNFDRSCKCKLANTMKNLTFANDNKKLLLVDTTEKYWQIGSNVPLSALTYLAWHTAHHSVEQNSTLVPIMVQELESEEKIVYKKCWLLEHIETINSELEKLNTLSAGRKKLFSYVANDQNYTNYVQLSLFEDQVTGRSVIESPFPPKTTLQ